MLCMMVQGCLLYATAQQKQGYIFIWGGGGEKQSTHCGRGTLENGVKGERFRLSGEVDTPEIILHLLQYWLPVIAWYRY